MFDVPHPEIGLVVKMSVGPPASIVDEAFTPLIDSAGRAALMEWLPSTATYEALLQRLLDELGHRVADALGLAPVSKLVIMTEGRRLKGLPACEAWTSFTLYRGDRPALTSTFVGGGADLASAVANSRVFACRRLLSGARRFAVRFT